MHSFEVKLETPYYVADSSLKFSATETGYYLKREGLPLGELTFSLTEGKVETGGDFDPVRFLIPKLAIAVGAVSLLIIGGVVTAIVFATRAERRKNAASPSSGVTEGKIPSERTDDSGKDER